MRHSERYLKILWIAGYFLSAPAIANSDSELKISENHVRYILDSFEKSTFQLNPFNFKSFLENLNARGLSGCKSTNEIDYSCSWNIPNGPSLEGIKIENLDGSKEIIGSSLKARAEIRLSAVPHLANTKELDQMMAGWARFRTNSDHINPGYDIPNYRSGTNSSKSRVNVLFTREKGERIEKGIEAKFRLNIAINYY